MNVGKVFVWMGILFFFLGVFFTLFEKFLLKLPGDIVVKKGNFTLYFPIATCILLSVILTLILNLIVRFLK